MTLALLLSTLALADDPIQPVVPVDGTAPSIAEGITLVPAGSLLTMPPPLPGAEPSKFTVPDKAFLLPETYYDTALIKAKQLAICQPALDTCTETALSWQKRSYDALTACSDQFGVDEATVKALQTQVQQQETRALVAEGKVKQARNMAGIAWGITGGLVLGSVTVVVLTLGN